jgi:MOSC domain-containing protein YiiM
MREGTVLAVCISKGGVPKLPVESARVTVEGIVGDGRDHAKHAKPTRAVSIQDDELLAELRAEGYPVEHGSMGENLTVRGLDVQHLAPGTQLALSGGVVLELTEVRKPCFVLDPIDPRLKEAVVERCGFMAKVVKEGELRSGEVIRVVGRGDEGRASLEHPDV